MRSTTAVRGPPRPSRSGGGPWPQHGGRDPRVGQAGAEVGRGLEVGGHAEVAVEVALRTQAHAGVDVEGRKGQELSLGVEGSLGYQCVNVGMEVGGVGAEGLQRGDAAGEGVGAAEDGSEALLDGGVGAAREQAEESALAFEETAERLGDGEHVVTMRNRSEDLVCESLGEERGALGLA